VILLVFVLNIAVLILVIVLVFEHATVVSIVVTLTGTTLFVWGVLLRLC
jgi:hypothetical protein